MLRYASSVVIRPYVMFRLAGPRPDLFSIDSLPRVKARGFNFASTFGLIWLKKPRTGACTLAVGRLPHVWSFVRCPLTVTCFGTVEKLNSKREWFSRLGIHLFQ